MTRRGDPAVIIGDLLMNQIIGVAVAEGRDVHDGGDMEVQLSVDYNQAGCDFARGWNFSGKS